VKYSRANFLTPMPHAPSFETLNAALEERCRVRQAERAGRHEQTTGRTSWHPFGATVQGRPGSINGCRLSVMNPF
jgi:hypothetical protein